MTSPFLNIQHLTKSFGATVAVNDVSLTVEPGEIFALIGPNGSGKSTIVKLVAGLLQPTAGSMSIGGVDLIKQPVEAKSIIGYIPDEPAVWSSMTGQEFLNFSGALYGLDEKTRHERLPALLDRFQLAGMAGEYFEDYSRGNKQKYSIVAALLHRPKLLLIDEPIVGLDPVSADVAQSLFTEYVRDGGAIILVTHTLNVAEHIASRIGVLENGSLVASGRLDELRMKASLPTTASLEDIYKALT